MRAKTNVKCTSYTPMGIVLKFILDDIGWVCMFGRKHNTEWKDGAIRVPASTRRAVDWLLLMLFLGGR